MGRQTGVSLWSVLFFAFAVCVLGAGIIKLTPDLIEYAIIRRDLRAVTQELGAKGATSAEIQAAFDARIRADNIKAISSADLDITRRGSETIVAFAYAREVPLTSNVRLVIDYSGTASSVGIGR